MAQLEQEIDRLYDLPLEEFTRERNAAASRLSKAGDSDGATELRGLQKPTVVAWTINQLARRNRDEVKALLAAGRELRKAHRAALSGQGAEGLAEASKHEREATTALVKSAQALLTEDGRTSSAQTLDKISATLRAAALDLEAGKVLEAGRLTKELEPSGFGPLLAAVPSSVAEKSPRKQPEQKRSRIREAQQAIREARAEERELRRGADAAERDAEKAAAEAERAAARADDATQDADAAAARITELEEELAKLRR